MAELNENGFIVRTFAQIKTALQDAYKAAFGNDIQLDEESPQGVIINKEAEMLENLEKIGLDLFTNFDVNTAGGVFLDNIAVIKGTERNDGTKAVADVTLTSSTQPYVIPAGTQFRYLNDPTIIFINQTSITVTSLTFVAQLIAQNNGKTNIEPNQKFQAVQFIAELDDINVDSIVDGTDVESDAELRSRLKRTNGQNASNDINSMFTAVSGLDNVQKVNILENDTDVTDLNGIPSHSVEVLVLGDTDENVANAIFSKKASGTGTYGTTPVIVQDIMGNDHTINFTRPDPIDVFVHVTVQPKEYQDSVDSTFFDEMKAEIATYIFDLRVGENVSYTTIYGIFAKYNAFDIVELELAGESGSESDSESFPDSDEFISGNLIIDIREYARMIDQETDIVITVI